MRMVDTHNNPLKSFAAVSDIGLVKRTNTTICSCLRLCGPQITASGSLEYCMEVLQSTSDDRIMRPLSRKGTQTLRMPSAVAGLLIKTPEASNHFEPQAFLSVQLPLDALGNHNGLRCFGCLPVCR